MPFGDFMFRFEVLSSGIFSLLFVAVSFLPLDSFQFVSQLPFKFSFKLPLEFSL